MKRWIQAARLRTLPLSISGIFLGSLLAASQGTFDWLLFGLACLTTLLFQVLSNYANDYGDGIKGTDKYRTGEKRAVASGEITAAQMKKAIIITGVLSLISAITLLVLAYIPDYWYWFVLYILMGFASIWAAINYTVGEKAYGYRALGDLFVFLFFGLLSVMGTYMLFTKTFDALVLLPAAATGLLSTAVLNLNNMRDIPQDRKADKKTMAVKLGFLYAKNYHGFLMFLPFLLGSIYVYYQPDTQWEQYLFLVLLIPAILLMFRVVKTEKYAKLDSELSKTAMLTLLFSLVFGFCQYFF